MIKFEEMPLSAQKSYKRTNLVRKIAMFIGWGIFIIECIDIFMNPDDYNGISKRVFLPIWVSAELTGVVHGASAYKKVLKKFGLFGVLCFAPAVAFVIGVLFSVFTLLGPVFWIADTVCFFKKRPLIYQSEMYNFLDNPKTQAEMSSQAYNERMHIANNEKNLQ